MSLNLHDLPDQLDRIAEADWDVLLVLDAFRWDYWDKITGLPGEPVRSPGQTSMEWIKAVFRHPDLRSRMQETICITANPEVTRHTNEVLFHDRDDLWEREWTHINGLPTVDPTDVTRAVQARLTVGPDRPVYAHYAQPHGPYPMAEPYPVPVMRNNPQGTTVEIDSDDQPNHVIMDPREQLEDDDHWLTPRVLREAYVSNIEWVMEAIKPLLNAGRTILVTSDHGELLGEEVTYTDVETGERRTGPMYGHPYNPEGGETPELRTVPFFRVV